MSDEVKLRRYYLPSVNMEGFAEIVIGSNGYFSVVSDYGNYAYRWTAFGQRDFRQFLMNTSSDYVRTKLNPETVFDVERTQYGCRMAICAARRRPSKGYEIDAGDARWAYDEVSGIGNEIELNDWFNDWGRFIEDTYGICCYKPDSQVTAFVEKTLPRLQKLLKEELFKEGLLG